MSFEKAEQLMELATMAVARHSGITIDDVIDRFGCAKRTAQRMLRALEERFLDTQTHFDDEGRKRWRLPQAAMRDLLTLTSDELASLDLAIASLSQSGQAVEAGQLTRLKAKILALVPRSKAARLETDYEALLEAQGFAARPGPRPRSDTEVMASISEALKGCRFVDISYQGRDEKNPRDRRIAPLGILLGLRRYIVARVAEDMTGGIRLFRAEGIRSARVTGDSFVRDPDFDLRAFANRAFGSFQNEKEFAEVVWQFAPEAAGHAREFQFHPEQCFEDQPDGSLIVRFRAAGHLEMCWHLYAWGDKVDVLAPEQLRQMVHPYRRTDFPALP
jgi:predicted DNA-binding transcriptional regulator YafY